MPWTGRWGRAGVGVILTRGHKNPSVPCPPSSPLASAEHSRAALHLQAPPAGQWKLHQSSAEHQSWL